MNDRARTEPTRRGRSGRAPALMGWTLGYSLQTILIVVLVVSLALALWAVRFVVLLIIAGALLATFFYASSQRLGAITGVPRLLALPLIVIVFAALLLAIAWQAGPTLALQMEQLIETVGTAASNLSQELTGSTGEEIVGQMSWQELLGFLPSPWGIASGATAVASAIFGGLASAAIILFFGLYFAGDPHTYTRLVVRLAPENKRGEALELLHEAGHVLRRWLVGQALAMAVIGIVTYAGLLFLGVPLAMLLGLFAALANFVPYLGPIIAGIPIVIVAAGEGMAMAVWALGFYLFIQMLESYLLTPLIQSRAVSLPPAIVIANQLLFGALFGLLGLILATPLAAVATVPLARIFRPVKE